MKHLLIYTVLMTVVVLGGCRSSSSQKPSVAAVPIESFAQQWKAELELNKATGDLTQLFLREDTLVAYTSGHWSFVLSRIGGTLQHVDPITTANTRLHPPVVMGQQVIYPTDNQLFVFSNRGRLQKTIDLPSASRSTAVGMGNNVYMGTVSPSGGRLTSVRIDGDYVPVQWEVYTYGEVSAAPAILQGVIYCGTIDGRVFAITTGRSNIWPFPYGFRIPGNIVADLKADESGVYVAGTDGKLLCLDRASGKMRWQYFAGKPLKHGVWLSPTTVYQFIDDQGLVAIEKFATSYNRTARWINRDAVQFLAEDARYSYVRLKNNKIAALNRETGEKVFENSRKDLVAFASNSKDATIYAATGDGQVFAIRPVLKPGVVGEVALLELPLPALASSH